MFGRLKLTWQDESPENNTFGTDVVFCNVNNQTQILSYLQKEIAQRSEESGYYKDISFNFLDDLYVFSKTRNLIEGYESDTLLTYYKVKRNELTSFAGIIVNPSQIKLAWTNNAGTGEALGSDSLYIKIKNNTQNDLKTLRFRQGNIAKRVDTQITVATTSLGDLGDEVEIRLGFVGDNGIYSEEQIFTRTIVVATQDLWKQGDNNLWLQGDGNNWIYKI